MWVNISQYHLTFVLSAEDLGRNLRRLTMNKDTSRLNSTLELQLNKVYTQRELVSKLKLVSDNISIVKHTMEEAGETDRVMMVYDARELNTTYKHALVTLIRKLDEHTWEGIMTVSAMGNTVPVHIYQKFFTVHLESSTKVAAEA